MKLEEVLPLMRHGIWVREKKPSWLGKNKAKEYTILNIPNNGLMLCCRYLGQDDTYSEAFPQWEYDNFSRYIEMEFEIVKNNN